MGLIAQPDKTAEKAIERTMEKINVIKENDFIKPQKS
jgi:hypothetical protein